MSEAAAPRLLTSAFVALTLADLAYFTAVGILLVATPLFVTGPLGGAEVGVGLAMGSFSISTLVLRPWAGRWADRHGRRRLLVVGAAAFAVVTLGYLVVDSLVALIGLRLLLGAAEAMFFVAGFAALADLAPPGRAGEALSLNSLALYVGIAIGPLLGQALLRWQGFEAAWVAAVALGGVAALVATRLPETRAPDEAAEPTPLVHPAAIVPGLALFSGIMAMSGFLAFAVLHARAIGVERWSGVLLLFGATVVLCRVVMAKLPDRVGPSRLAGAALALSALGLVGIGVWEVPLGLLLGTLVLAVGVAFVTPAVFAAVFNAVPPTERGSAAGTTSVFIDLGLGGGPMLLGAVAAATSLPASFVIFSALPLAGTVLLAADGFRRLHVPATP